MNRIVLPSSRVWSIVLLVAGCAVNGALSCGANLVAFAVVAALTLPRRFAYGVAALVWVESQALGYGVFAYPRTAESLTAGCALGVATLIAVAAAVALRRFGVFAFGGAFAAYEGSLAALLIAGTGEARGFTAAIVGELGLDNALVALGLCVLCAAAASVERAVRRARVSP